MILLSLMSSWAQAASVLIIYDSYGSEVISLQSYLNSNGHTATLSTTAETSYTGLNPSLTGIDVVIHMNGPTYDLQMPTSGQQAIMDFVNAGGGYIGTEWSAYERNMGRMGTMNDLVLLDRSSGNTATITWS